MVRSPKIGFVHSLLSGVLWASYCVVLYSLLNPYYGDTGDLSSPRGVMFVLLAAVGIAWIDALITGVYEIVWVIINKQFQEFKKLLFSKTLLRIAPAALFAGALGLVPYTIASRYSVSVATSISAFYPALGSIIAIFWFKEKLTPMKFVGILCAIGGVVIISGFSGLHPVGIAFAIFASIGYSLELDFGYRLMKEDVHPNISLALKQVSAIIIYTIVMIVFLLIPGNWEFFKNLVSMVNFNDAYAFTAGVMNHKLWIWAAFALASFLNAAAYVEYFKGMNHAGVSTASSLNIAYGIWTTLMLSLPPFREPLSLVCLIGALVTFAGSVTVIIESNRLLKKEAAAGS